MLEPPEDTRESRVETRSTISLAWLLRRPAPCVPRGLFDFLVSTLLAVGRIALGTGFLSVDLFGAFSDFVVRTSTTTTW